MFILLIAVQWHLVEAQEIEDTLYTEFKILQTCCSKQIFALFILCMHDILKGTLDKTK